MQDANFSIAESGEFVQSFKRKRCPGGKDIVKKFSTPESIRELSDQLNNLDESMNGLYRQREKAPAPKKGFFDRVRTAFRSLKGE